MLGGAARRALGRLCAGTTWPRRTAALVSLPTTGLLCAFGSERPSAGGEAEQTHDLPRLAAAAAKAFVALLGLEQLASRALCEPRLTGSLDALDDRDWNRTISAALPAVVSIKVNRVRSFDTASAGTVQATGFVVDAERGFILTNRHVAGPGPIVAEAVFQNNEEVPLSLAYYDPVHDFAFFRFDPAALRHMKPVALDLAPEQAEMTSEIVIIGNNAGEKCSIHRTTLARLDRNAPAYSRSSYNDFNTFYMHSASGTSGGSSGSPVLNKKGVAIALNAGGKAGTTAGFFLPLDRVARALALLQVGRPVPRGTLQMVCTHQTYDEALRLGLPKESEGSMRADGAHRGVLVVAEILPEGPAAAAGLQPGDVVLSVNGVPCVSFVTLEGALDDNVGATAVLQVCRGGIKLERIAQVGDLHAITPSCYVEVREVGGAALNELSYQQARNHGIPVRGVYVSHPGYMLYQARMSKGSIILAINGTPTPTLRDFLSAISTIPHGEHMTVRYVDLGSRAHTHLASLRMDRKWFGMRSGHRDPVGDWKTAPLEKAAWLGMLTAESPSRGIESEFAQGGRFGSVPDRTPTSPLSTGATTAPSATAETALAAGERTLPDADSTLKHTKVATPASAAEVVDAASGQTSSSGGEASGGEATASPSREATAEAAMRAIRNALVSVDFSRPFCIDGETGMRYRGTGLVVDAERGLIAVDRNTVTSTLGDVSITFGGRVTVSGSVEYVHPMHNFAIVRYDPASVPEDVIVRSAALSPRPLRPGSEVTLVGLKSGLNENFDAWRRVDLICRKTRVANVGWIKLPQPNPPQFQIQNVETIGLEVAPSLDGGVLASDDGTVAALWASCAYQPAPNQSAAIWRGLPIEIIKSVSDRLVRGEQPTPWRSLGATLEPISIAAARQLGIDDDTLVAHATPPQLSLGTAAREGSDGAAALSASDDEDGQPAVLMVTHVHQGYTSGRGALRGGDLLLSIDGTPIRSLYEAECATQRSESIKLDVMRDGKPESIVVTTTSFDGLGTRHVLGWAGVLVQETPDAVRSQRAVPPAGVYISYRFYGSPASRYDLSPTLHIVEVDSVETPDLDAFIRCTRGKDDGEVVRLKVVDLEGRCRMTTMKLDLKYWPMFSLSRNADGEWVRQVLCEMDG